MNTTNMDSTGARRDRLLKEHVHDPYKTRLKLPEPTQCSKCGAVLHEGRWQWMDSPPAGAHRGICQACHRIQDKYPAGILTLSGKFVVDHRAELLQMARHHEAEEKSAHPLHRIMEVEDHPDTLVITTTDIHLPRRIGEALRHSYKGTLGLDYDIEGYFLRADWSRD